MRAALACGVGVSALALGVTLVPAGAETSRYPTRSGDSTAWSCTDWPMYGRSHARTFSTDCSDIDRASARRLVPAWTFRPTPKADANGQYPVDQASFTASPTIVQGVVYIGGWDGVMYALRESDGTVLWQSETDPAPGATYGPIIGSAAVAKVDGRLLVIFGSGPKIYALDANNNGERVWVHQLGDPNKEVNVQSSPLIWRDRVYVGMDVHDQSGDEVDGVQGGLLRLDAATGKTQWKFAPERRLGQPASGCGGVWGSPTLDTATGTVYFGTANCPAIRDNDKLPMESVWALDAETGALRWRFVPHAPPDEDQDFGATPNLYVDANGRKVLGAGNKDGRYYALNPSTGKKLWSTKVTTPAPGVGGFIGSPAVWHGKVFGTTAIGTPPGYHAIDGATGERLWDAPVDPSYAASAVTHGVAFSGALDGVLKAYDTRNGNVLWASPTLGPIASGPAISGDTVVIGSGLSTSDLCAKGRPGSEACFLFFDVVLGQPGGVHAFRVVGP